MKKVQILISGKCEDDLKALKLYNALYSNKGLFEKIEFDYDDQFIETLVILNTESHPDSVAKEIEKFLELKGIGFRVSPDKHQID